MFKLPHVAPQQQVDSTTHTADSIFISEAGILRFARDYGLTPYVASTKQVRGSKCFSGIIAFLVFAWSTQPCLVCGNIWIGIHALTTALKYCWAAFTRGVSSDSDNPPLRDSFSARQ
jgi:hypothetical protein